VWLPGLSELNVWVVELVQRPNGAPSSEHRTVEIASFAEKVNVGEFCVVGFVGSEEVAIVTEIGTGSRSIVEIVPVSVGPFGWSA
jgi:hypothetical protein